MARCMVPKFVVFLFLLGGAVHAQVLECTSSVTQVNARSESFAERVSDVLLSCQTTDPGPPGQSYLTTDIRLALSTNMTNRVVVTGDPDRGEPDRVDAILVINDNHADPTVLSTLGGPAGSVPMPQYAEVISGSFVQTNSLRWTGVQLPIPGAVTPDGKHFPSRTRIRITNLRVDPNFTGVSSFFTDVQVQISTLTVANSAPLEPDPQKVVATVKRSLDTSARGDFSSLSQCEATNLVDGRVSGPPTFTYTFRELFASAFRPLGEPSTDGGILPGEAGYPTPGVGVNGGGADQGTRLALYVQNIPPGARLAVPSRIVNGSLALQLVRTSANGSGAYAPIESDELVEIGASQLAVYEVVSSDNSILESAVVPVTVGYAAGAVTNTVLVAQAGGGYAPFYDPSPSVRKPSATLPIPRFVIGAVPEDAFKIQPCTNGQKGQPELLATSFNAGAQAVAGGRLTGGHAVVKNQGAADAGPFRLGFYFQDFHSSTPVFSGSFCTAAGGLAANASWTCDGDIAVPVPPGTYFVAAVVDDLEQVTESNEANNFRFSDSGAVRVLSAGEHPDLIITALTAPRQAVAGSTLEGMLVVMKNQGAADAGAFRLGFYYSTTPTVSRSSIFSGWTCRADSGLAAGQTTSCGGMVGVPADPGTYYLGAIIDDADQVEESDEDNNTYVADSGTITVLDAGQAPPAVSMGGVLNAASYTAFLAPGALGSVFGSALSGGEQAAAAFPLPRELGGTRVFVNGSQAAVVYASPMQVNFQTPVDLDPSHPAQLEVENENGRSDPVNVPVVENLPAIFRLGTGPAVVHADYSPVTQSNPARPGEVLIAYGTGLGSLSNPPATGQAASGNPLSVALNPPVMTLDGSPVELLFAGLTPGFAGLVQYNFRVGADAQPGEKRLELRSGDVADEVLIWIGAAEADRAATRR